VDILANIFAMKIQSVRNVLLAQRFVADVVLWIKKWNVPNSILARMTLDVISSAGKCGIAYVINVVRNVVFFLSILVL